MKNLFQTEFPNLENEILRNVNEALTEDLGADFRASLKHSSNFNSIDLTSSIVDRCKTGKASVIAKEDAIFCGRLWFEKVFENLSEDINIRWEVVDGDKLKNKKILCEIDGPIWAILAGERTALNFIQTLSGTATRTFQIVKLLSNSPTKILDTRKTIPGLRLAQKYAVACGGGKNHRLGLYDEILIKENHIAAVGSVEETLSKMKERFPNKLIEIEVEDLNQLKRVIKAGADIVLLDNFSTTEILKAIKIINNKAKIEISGNINAENIPELTTLGVDYISVGAITKHISAIDLSMYITHTD
ncbi:MAG: carboxylating nicotinate-nucleotide diphosphorylase [Pseudomonadota bacterium]|nr:carboxylating nicotinate-nucleotide diphosphorylase [Pseudomonadota bacterium]